MYGLGLGQLGRVGGKTWNERTALWPLGTEPGLWIDPSTTSASYQDSAGTTALSAIGTVLDSANPVGLQLDRKYGGVVGPELVTNGDFSAGLTGWINASTGTGTATVSGGQLSLYRLDGSNAGKVAQYIGEAGKTYQVDFDVVSGLSFVSLAGAGGNYNAGSYSFKWICLGSGFYLESVLDGTTCVVDNISVREIPGLHLSQATSAARPFASARVNKILGSESVYGANWTLGGTQTNTQNYQSINGVSFTKTVPSVTSDAKGGYYALIHATLFPANLSIEVKGAGYRYLQIYDAGSATLGTLIFDTQTGTFSTNSLSNPVSVEALANGVFRISCVIYAAGSYGVSVCISGTSGSNFGNYAQVGDGVSGMLLSAFQITEGAAIKSYQRVNTASDYTAAGFPVVDKFDGVDDALASATVAAGVVGNSNMDCLIAVRRDSAAAGILGLYAVPGDARWFGAAKPATPASCVNNSGTPTVWVDGVQLAGGTSVSQTTLDAALTPGVFHVLEFRGLDLSAWTMASIGAGYGTYELNGAIGGKGIMLFPAASAADRDKARTRLAASVGLVL